MPISFLRAVSRTMPKKDDRPYLQGVHVINGLVEATDGKVVIRVQSSQIESDGEYVIKDTSIFRLLRDRAFLMSVVDGISDVAGRVELACEGGEYPNLSPLFEREGEPGVAQIDPDLLVRVKRAMQDLGSKYGLFLLRQRGELQARVEEEYGGAVLTALIAPWRP